MLDPPVDLLFQVVRRRRIPLAADTHDVDRGGDQVAEYGPGRQQSQGLRSGRFSGHCAEAARAQ
jgi:hypothetical protein